MRCYNSTIVKAIPSCIGGKVEFYGSLSDCCLAYGIRYEHTLKQLIENGGVAPDGKTFFDYPTDLEMLEIQEGTISIAGKGARK